jgi:lipoprotein NlpI
MNSTCFSFWWGQQQQERGTRVLFLYHTEQQQQPMQQRQTQMASGRAFNSSETDSWGLVKDKLTCLSSNKFKSFFLKKK